MNNKNKSIFASKRGAIQLMGLLMNPWIWAIIGLFLLGFWFTSLFMLGKILGAVLIVGALIGMMRGMVSAKMAVFLIAIAVLLMWNPLDWQALSFIRG